MTLDGTNTWLLGDVGGPVVVVDPGPLDEAHLTAIAESGSIARILLTHGHLDHSEGAHRLHDMTGAPVAAFDPSWLRGADALDEGDRLLHAEIRVEVWRTPGHSADSLSFVARSASDAAVLTGDTVLGRGSTLVDHPEGRLRDYLESLERLASLDDAVVLPGHGPHGARVGELAQAYLEHRHTRLAQVRAALNAGAVTSRDVVDAVYADVPDHLKPAAERNVLAQLTYLSEQE
jgi:glyoxylase-like metal-dependent hydrolase (beta-lactamase superfamily II)